MILLNFGKKLDPISLELFKQMSGTKIDEQIMLPLEASSTDEFMKAWEAAVQKVKLSEEELREKRFVINPSGNQVHMLVLTAYLFKKSGKMPIILVTRAPVFGLSARQEIQEVIDLQKWIE